MTRRNINRITVALLLLGLGSALVVYLTAERRHLDPLLGDPLASKKYLRELRMIGGKANVLAAELQDWFEGLWEGESLAGTLAVLTVGAVVAFRFFARLPDDSSHSAPEKQPVPDRSETGG